MPVAAPSWSLSAAARGKRGGPEAGRAASPDAKRPETAPTQLERTQGEDAGGGGTASGEQAITDRPPGNQRGRKKKKGDKDKEIWDIIEVMGKLLMVLGISVRELQGSPSARAWWQRGWRSSRR